MGDTLAGEPPPSKSPPPPDQVRGVPVFALAHGPSQRFERATAMAHALEDWLRQLVARQADAVPEPEPKPEPTTAPSPRRSIPESRPGLPGEGVSVAESWGSVTSGPMRGLGLGLVLVLGALAVPGRALAGPHDGLPAPQGHLPRATPRQTVQLFLNETRAGNYLRAAYTLDLRGIPVSRQERRGPELARELKRVLDRGMRLDPASVPDAREGDPEAPSDLVEIGALELRGEEVPVTLRRVDAGDGSRIWVFSRRLVDRVPALHDALEPSWIEESLPASFSTIAFWNLALWQWLGLIVALLLAWLVGVLVAALALRIGHQVTSRTEVGWDDRLIDTLRGPTRFVIALVVFRVSMKELRLPLGTEDVVLFLLKLAGIAAGGWVAMRLVTFVADGIEAHGTEVAGKEGDRGKARAVQTQVRVLRRVGTILAGVAAGALMLLQFEVVRTLGLSLLASAGIAGVVLGLAAQKSIAGLLAGIQLSITQPIRIGDTVIVEGEWGTIEEVNLTYVVVKVWDERRLVVPISRFLESPFQNWTKVSPELHGTVFLYADYTLPLEKMREELDRILEGNENWDGRGKGLLVTDVTERTIQVRAMVTAADASRLWTLRCEVRERLVAWLRDYEGGRHLPRTRVEAGDDAAQRAGSTG